MPFSPPRPMDAKANLGSGPTPEPARNCPLSYRDWAQTYDPREIGISTWQMTHHFGPRIPGGGLGIAPDNDAGYKNLRPMQKPKMTQNRRTTGTRRTTGRTPARKTKKTISSARWAFSGSLEIDCMVCHCGLGGVTTSTCGENKSRNRILRGRPRPRSD